MTDRSPAQQLLEGLAPLGAGAHDVLEAALRNLSRVELAAITYDWAGFFARPKQIVPRQNWQKFGFMSGRGFGKTRACAEYVRGEIESGRAMRVALMAATEDDARGTMVEGRSGLEKIAPPWFRPVWAKGEKPPRLVYPNGAEAFVLSAEAPKKARGPEYHLAWCEEIAAWAPSKNESDDPWNTLEDAVRLGYSRMIWSSTPRPVALVRKLVDASRTMPETNVIVSGSTLENRANLPHEYVNTLLYKYAGTRLGRQELEGVLLEDNPGALFRQEWIQQARRPEPKAFELKRTIVAIDPAISDRPGADLTGIVVAGLGFDGQIYVLADYSGRHTAEAWARLTIQAANRFNVDSILAEQNRGGTLVKGNLRAFDLTAQIKPVHAKRAKGVRAEPVATLYEKGRVSHVIGADLADLEEQMVSWDATTTRGKSPDRIDALVHAIWELSDLDAAGPAEAYTQVSAHSRVTGPSRASAARTGDWEGDDDDVPHRDDE